MKAIIAGGGIGGLTAALCLNQAGINIELFEQADQFGDVGAGIQLSPNAMKVFEALGIDEDLQKVAFRPEAIEIRMGETGTRLIRTPLGDTAQARYGSPYLHIHRADLIAVLAKTVLARMPGNVRFGNSITSYVHGGPGVRATLSNGEDVTGDLLIGADGIHSKVRQSMLGHSAPKFTGNVAWRAVVPMERLGSNAPDPVVCAWMGRGKHVVTYRIRQGKLANLVAVVERDDWTKEGWSEQGRREEALADFKDWHPKVRNIIAESDTLFRWALYDRPPLQTWTDNAVALIGDAAHPMLPFMAQGAAMAIEDAWAIAAKLNKTEDIPSALQAYQSLRYRRASRVQALSRANAKTFHQSSRLGQLMNYGPMWLAGKVAPIIGLKRQDPIYSYDIVTEAK